jgi:hypothetical protein
MKISHFGILLISIFSSVKSVEAQSGWLQTQINPGLGYNLTVTDSNIFASASSGVYTTTNDGMPWFSKGPANQSVYDVIKTEHSILAATVDGIIRSTDNGNSWTLASNEVICSGVGGTQGNQVFTKNDSYIFSHSWAKGVFRSGDEGKTWQLLTVGTQSGYSGDLGEWAACIYAFDGKIFIGAPGGDIGIYYSADNGNSWNKASSGSPIQYNEFLFFHADKDTLYAGGFMGLYRSIDKGVNWTPQYLNVINSDGQMSGIGTFRDIVSYQDKLLAAVDAKSIQISQNGGKSWTDFNTGLITDWTFADLEIKPPYIWALTGFFGNAYRISLSEIVTAAKPELSNKTNSFFLEQNFPNPVKSSSTIRYTINNAEKIELSIFDIFGKEVVSLLNSLQYPGSYETTFNVKNLKNGTYFYRLKTGSDSNVRKFTVLRNE